MEPHGPHDELVTYFVNTKRQTSEDRKLSVRTILADAGLQPPESYTLEREEGHHVYTDYGELVPLHDGERFLALFNGPTPTSYGAG
jgi:hypothetical protein